MDRRAPVQRERATNRPAGTVPWDVHERAWARYAELGHGAQSAERIAERGGFGYGEMACLLAGHDPHSSDPHRHRPVPGWQAVDG